MLEVAGEGIETLAMDHHGLVAAMCKELKIAQRIDARLSNTDKRQIVSTGQKTAAYKLHYGEIEQRWLLVYSEQAYQREKKTLEKQLDKQEALLRKALWHISQEQFNCEKDGFKALKPLKIMQIHYHNVVYDS